MGLKRGFVGLLLENIAPDFIALNIGDGNVDQRFSEELFAAFPGQHRQSQYGVAVQPCNALGGTNAVALKEPGERWPCSTPA
jgi:hypothetical protein